MICALLNPSLSFPLLYYSRKQVKSCTTYTITEITVKWEGGILRIVSPQRLINLKSLRLSGTDQNDIAHLESIVNDN